MKNTSNFDCLLNLSKHILDEIDNPIWGEGSRCNNWKNYVYLDFKKNWHLLTDRERLIIAYLADCQADKEEWD